jgi:hypothetical protein
VPCLPGTLCINLVGSVNANQRLTSGFSDRLGSSIEPEVAVFQPGGNNTTEEEHTCLHLEHTFSSERGRVFPHCASHWTGMLPRFSLRVLRDGINFSTSPRMEGSVMEIKERCSMLSTRTTCEVLIMNAV